MKCTKCNGSGDMGFISSLICNQCYGSGSKIEPKKCAEYRILNEVDILKVKHHNLTTTSTSWQQHSTIEFETKSNSGVGYIVELEILNKVVCCNQTHLSILLNDIQENTLHIHAQKNKIITRTGMMLKLGNSKLDFLFRSCNGQPVTINNIALRAEEIHIQ